MLCRHVPTLPLFAGIVLMVCVATCDAVGQEQSFARANCAITPPPDWETFTPPQEEHGPVLAVFKARDQRRTVAIMKYGVSGPLDGWFAIGIEGERTRWDLGYKTSGRFADAYGLKCYERCGELAPHLLPATTFLRAIPTSAGTYYLKATTLDGKVEEDADVQRTLASFRFLRPPSAAPQSRTGGQLFRLYLGYYGVPSLVVFILIVAVLVIVGVVLRLRRHIRTAAYAPHLAEEGEPPPLPSAPADSTPGPYDY